MSDVFSNSNDLRVARTELLLRISPHEAFAFFADPRHLIEITPSWHVLTVHCPDGADWMSSDARYSISLTIHGHAVEWQLRIAEWKPRESLLIEQVDGPYTEFRHRRDFEAIAGGTRVTERIEYAHLGGSLYQRLIIQPELELLFAHRHRRILEKFGLTDDPEQGRSSNVSHAAG